MQVECSNHHQKIKIMSCKDCMEEKPRDELQEKYIVFVFVIEFLDYDYET